MTIRWEKDLPSKPGVYWFDTGFRAFGLDTPMVIKVYETGSIFAYGDYGSGPITAFYSGKLSKKAFHAEIEPASKWRDHIIFGRTKSVRAWVRDPNNHLGFGLLQSDYNKGCAGSVLWLDHPTCGEVHGDRLGVGEGYQFSIVQIPKLA